MTLNIYLERLESRISNRFDREYSKLGHAEQMAIGRNPDRILALGFAIVRHEGKAVTNSSALSEGAKLDITLSRGSAEAYVKSTEDER